MKCRIILVRIFKRLVPFVLLVSLLLVLVQDIMIFPGVYRTIPNSVPEGLERFQIETEDSESIEVLFKKGEDGNSLSGYSAMFMHGNFETVYSSIIILDWLSSLGLNSYVFDYRGFGNSTGWPSEKGISLDSQAVWRFIRDREGLTDASKLFIVGNSIGTGFAAELASKIEPHVLLLLAPYIDLPNVVRQNILFRPLIPFLRYRIPTLEYLKSTNKTCLVLAHGKQDKVIKVANSETMYQEIKATKNVHLILNERSGHNDIIFRAKADLSRALTACVLEQSH